MLYFRERYPLFLKCLQYYSEAGGSIGEAYDSIYRHISTHTMLCPLRLTLKVHTKYGILDTPISIENEVWSYMERHPLLLEYSITFLRYISEMEGPSDSIHTPLMARTLPFLPMLTPKFDTKYKISGTLSAWGIGFCAA